ncbi:MAG: tRNA (guanosine(37)-N1)-methyltransferase TrmD, partial [Candidatus Zixiibacteriota bacterium]
VMLDAIVRLLPGVLGNFESALEDSHLEGLLGAPVYTRPEEYRGLKVPSELLSGDHKLIEKYRRQEAIRKTVQNRPELLKKADLGQDDLNFADRLRHENNK